MSSDKKEVLKLAIAQIEANKNKAGTGEDIYKGRIIVELNRWVNIAKLYGVEIPQALESEAEIVKMFSNGSFPLPKRFRNNFSTKQRTLEIDPYRNDTRRGIGGYPKND